MWTPCGTPPWHVQMSIGSVRHQLWASYGELLYCAVPCPLSTTQTFSTLERRSLFGSKMWHLNFFFFYARCSDVAHTHQSTHESASLWRRWEHHPEDPHVRRRWGGGTRYYQTPSAVEMQVATTPMSNTINHALCRIPTVPMAPIWQPLMGGHGTGNTLSLGCGLPHPCLFRHHFCSVIAQ